MSRREATVLASIEAEFRKCDPQLLALFDRLGTTAPAQGGYRRPAGMRWARLCTAMLLVALALAAMLIGGHLAGLGGCPPARASCAITGFADRVVGSLQAQTASWAHEIKTQMCQSVPARGAIACG